VLVRVCRECAGVALVIMKKSLVLSDFFLDKIGFLMYNRFSKWVVLADSLVAVVGFCWLV